MSYSTSNMLICQRCFRVLNQGYATSATSAHLPRITVPHKMQERIQRTQQKQSAKEHQKKRRYKGPLIISCYRKEFNHFKGQTYSNFSPDHLASSGWKHYKSKGDYFTINAYQSNPSLLVSGKDVPSTFKSMGLHPGLLTGLSEMGISKPTNIQARTIPVMLHGKNVMCVAETGSGKTLAYLLPLLQRIHRFHEEYGSDSPTNTPKAVILVPSKELANQIFDVASHLSNHSNFQPYLVTGGNRTQHIIRERSHSIRDLLIATPGVYSKLLSNRLYDLSQLQNIVLDEADSMLDDSFNELTLRIIRKMKIVSEKLEVHGDSVSVGTQMTLVGATIPRDLDNILEGVVPISTISQVTTDNIHRLMPHVPQKFVRIGSGDKPVAVVSALKSNVNRKIPTIVFCNTSKTACYISYLLDDSDVPNVVFTADLPRHSRAGRFEKFQGGEVDVLVCTDVASRGLDTIRAQHVINYDFPAFISDYIHRVGRVGRVGSLGTSFALSYVTHKWDVDLLWKIESSVRRVTELHNVNANIHRKLTGRAESKKMQGEGISIAPDAGMEASS